MTEPSKEFIAALNAVAAMHSGTAIPILISPTKKAGHTAKSAPPSPHPQPHGESPDSMKRRSAYHAPMDSATKPEIEKTWTYSKHGAFASFRMKKRTINGGVLMRGGAVDLVSENNWMRRFLYWIGAPRRMTRRV